MHHLETNQLKISVDPKGAELRQVFHKQHHLEYMWGADPAYWAKTSPVLFPIVGQLKNNTYQYKGTEYHLSRHGFARDKVFDLTDKHDQSLTFSLQSNDETFAVYPFLFLFQIVFGVKENTLTVTYKVKNEGGDDLYFSVGAHPAFRLPLVEGTSYNDYRLVFNQKETAGRWPISKDGLIEAKAEPLLEDTNTLPLSKDLFRKDAVVLKHLQSDEVKLVSDQTPHGLTFSFPGFPFLGLWAAPGADFLCIEPWCGIADSVNADGQLQHKEGINQLAPGETFSVSWRATFF